MATKKKVKKEKPKAELTLWGVVLSYPDLHDPKPYNGKVTYKTDVLIDLDDVQLKKLKTAIKSVHTKAWGEDQSEWPEEKIATIKDGDARADQKGYDGKKYITASTQNPVPVVDPKGKAFSAQMVKGGMFANVAISISAWENEFGVGSSIYLQGVQIDTSKASLNFGGGKSVKQMFSRNEDESEEEDHDLYNDEEDEPRKAKSKKGRTPDEDEEDSEDESFDEEQDEEDSPRKSKKKSAHDFDEDDS